MELGKDLLSLGHAHVPAQEKGSLDTQSASSLKEHDYIGLAEVSSASPAQLPECQTELNLAETELHLGLGLGFGPLKKTIPAEDSYEILPLTLAQKEAGPKPTAEAQKCPGMQRPRQCAAPMRDTSTENLHSATLASSRDFQSSKVCMSAVQDYGEGSTRACATLYGGNSSALKNGTKRAYTEAMNEAAKFSGAAVMVGDLKSLPKHQQVAVLPNWKPGVAVPWQAGVEQSSVLSFSSSKVGQTVAAPRAEKPAADRGVFSNKAQDISGAVKESVANEEPPPPKGQVVGWPPVRSYRKNMVKPIEMFVKVNMDGVTVGRKVDLNAHHSYESLLSALEEMFQPSNNAQGGSHASSSREDAKHLKLLNGSDFVLTYEDQDGDWMMVGDVPWSMFVNMVRRLRITRGSEAVGLAPTRPERVK